MDRTPTLGDFQTLQHKVRDQQGLERTGFELLEAGTEAIKQGFGVSSQVINTVNSVWMTISQLKDTFWDTIGVMAASRQIATKSMSISLMARRIADDGSSLSEGLKLQLIEFLYDNQENVTANQRMYCSQLRPTTCEALVSLLKLQWRGLFKNYLESMAGSIKTFGVWKMCFILDVLRRVVRQGYDNWYDQVTFEAENQFRIQVEESMRYIIQISCYALNGDGHLNVTNQCLSFLIEVLPVMPAFEIFNCSLIDLLLQLLDHQEHHQKALLCMKEIFAFKEDQNIKDHHLKIAKKLLSVLDKLLARTGLNQGRPKRTVTYHDRQSESTNDSFYSQSTHKQAAKSRKEVRQQTASQQVIQLLDKYLSKYVPFMEAKPVERNYQIQSDSSLKLSFDKELYEQLTDKYWLFIDFLVHFGSQMSNNLTVKEDRELENEEYFLNCLKLALEMSIKLQITQSKDLSEVLNIFIIKFTPIPKGFKRLFTFSNLITDESGFSYPDEEVREAKDEEHQNYMQVISTIIYHRRLHEPFRVCLLRLLEEVGLIDQENDEVAYVGHKVNLINRVVWCLVATFSNHSFSLKQFEINQITGSLLVCCSSAPDGKLSKCLGINIKYMLLIDHHYFAPIILTGSEFNQENSYEMHCIILSNYVLNDQFSLKDMNLYEEIRQNCFSSIVDMASVVAASHTYHDEFRKIYPAIVKLASCIKRLGKEMKLQEVGISQTNMDKKVKDMLYKILYTPLNEYIGSLQTNSTNNIHEVNICLEHLSLASNYMISDAQKKSRKDEKQAFGVMRMHNKRNMQFIQRLGEYFNNFGNMLSNLNSQNYQAELMQLFRINYHHLVINFIKIHRILDYNSSLEKQNNRPQKSLGVMLDAIMKMLQGDFYEQRHFKCSTYLDVIFQFLKTIACSEPFKYKNELNQMLVITNNILDQKQAQVDELIVKKLDFWSKIVEEFLFDLSLQNLQTFQINFRSLNVASSSAQIELSIDLVEKIFKKLDYVNNSSDYPLIWQNIFEYIQDTFENVINLTKKNEQLFKKLSHLFYIELMTITHNNKPLDPQNSNHPNSSILYTWLCAHVHTHIDRLSPQFRECHDAMLSKLFTVNHERDFTIHLRNYRLALFNWIRESQKNQLMGNFL